MRRTDWLNCWGDHWAFHTLSLPWRSIQVLIAAYRSGVGEKRLCERIKRITQQGILNETNKTGRVERPAYQQQKSRVVKRYVGEGIGTRRFQKLQGCAEVQCRLSAGTYWIQKSCCILGFQLSTLLESKVDYGIHVDSYRTLSRGLIWTTADGCECRPKCGCFVGQAEVNSFEWYSRKSTKNRPTQWWLATPCPLNSTPEWPMPICWIGSARPVNAPNTFACQSKNQLVRAANLEWPLQLLRSLKICVMTKEMWPIMIICIERRGYKTHVL